MEKQGRDLIIGMAIGILTLAAVLTAFYSSI